MIGPEDLLLVWLSGFGVLLQLIILSQQADMQSIAEPSQAKLPKISVELARLSKTPTIGASTLLSDRLLGHGSSPPS